MVERESATFDFLSLVNAGIAKCVDQIYPLLYPQMIGLCGMIFYIIDSFPHKINGKVSQYIDIILASWAPEE